MRMQRFQFAVTTEVVESIPYDVDVRYLETTVSNTYIGNSSRGSIQ